VAVIRTYRSLRTADAPGPQRRGNLDIAGAAGQAARPVGRPAAATANGAVSTIKVEAARGRAVGKEVQLEARRWAQNNRAEDGSLLSGRDIGTRYSRHERLGADGEAVRPGGGDRLVRLACCAGDRLDAQTSTPERPEAHDHGRPWTSPGPPSRRGRLGWLILVDSPCQALNLACTTVLF
jgi:hypothetical protein